jgi:hypothetical protein
MMAGSPGWCAADYTETDIYSDALCGLIRGTAAEAIADARRDSYDGVRYVGCDGYLYLDAIEAPHHPSAEAD